MIRMRPHSFLLTTLLALALPACGGGGADHDDEHAHEGDDHVHGAPHAAVGGVLVELGDHFAQLELVPDPETGVVCLFFWDGHAENPVRLAQPSLLAKVVVPDGKGLIELSLAAQASTLTGETVGDSAEFRVQDDRLKGVQEFHMVVWGLNVLGTAFEKVSVSYPQ
jgi:hypothetical protein